MKPIFIGCISLLLQLSTAFGQIKYEKGYFIDNNNQKTSCLIWNMDWKNNPKEIKCKQSETDEPTIKTTANIKEFGIEDYARFIRKEVQIDRSSANIDHLSKQRNPEWAKETLFLKVIVEGTIPLYQHEDDLQRFFYEKNDSVIQLIYKKYTPEIHKVATNKGFQQQIWTALKCGDTPLKTIEKLHYTTDELVDYFKKYNQCLSGTANIEEAKQPKRDWFNLKIAPGINRSAVTIGETSPNTAMDIKASFHFRAGIEAEFILPFNRNKWGIVVEPTYHRYKAAQMVQSRVYNPFMVDISYNSIDFPIGVRYYTFLNDKARIFVNAFYVPSFSFQLKPKVQYGDMHLTNESPTDNFAFGAGATFKRFSLEARYNTNREILGNYSFRYANYRRLAFILGFRLF